MRALVIGGTGFIGSHIVRDLASKGIHVSILTRKNKKIPHCAHKGIAYRYGDILKADSLKDQIKHVDVVYSAFGKLGQWNIPEKIYWDINTTGVKNLLKSCLNSGIQQLIHISSAGVLGPLPEGAVADESFPFNPSNIYERTKCEAEKTILQYGKTHGLPFTIIRPEFVYGPGDRHVLGLFKAIRDRKFVLLGSGTSYLHPTYIEDLICGIGRCAANPDAIGKTFLITGDRPYTVKELAIIIAEEFRIRPPRIKIPLALANTIAAILEPLGKILGLEPPLTGSRVRFFSENRAFSYRSAETVLGYAPNFTFRDGVRRTIRWYRENGYL